MFELDQFVFDCRAALREDAPQRSVREVAARAVSDPRAVLKALGEPQRAEMQTLYRSDDLTILNVIWAPWMNLLPHNHQMWAIIGLYTGREDNIFWRRVAGSNGLVEAAGARALREKDAEPLGAGRHPFGEQSNSQIDRRDSRLWRRFFWRSAQRMGR